MSHYQPLSSTMSHYNPNYEPLCPTIIHAIFHNDPLYTSMTKNELWSPIITEPYVDTCLILVIYELFLLFLNCTSDFYEDITFIRYIEVLR